MQFQHPEMKGPRRPLFGGARGVDERLSEWRAAGDWRNVVLDVERPARQAVVSPLPASVAPGLRRALAEKGITALYQHQARAFELAEGRSDFVVATPTASGKSLCYNLPILQTFSESADARALYLFPTKALSRDQEESLRGFLNAAGLDHGAITYDGDTPGDARKAARERTGILLTNPDMLHSGILPHHSHWARFFANLEYVVIDELHTYRGVFGSHLANVVRRLKRIAKFHGSAPRFILASATIGNPAEHAGRIVGREVSLIGESGAPAGPRQVVIYNPPVVNAELGLRASYLKTAVRITADLIRAQIPTLLFGQSRNGVETMLKYLRDRLEEDPVDPEAIVAYRGGYLPQTRRRIEKELREGKIRCVVATSALELGIDIGSLDAVVCAGYPGSVAGLWQRFGRAGRRRERSLSVLVPSSMPLDQYFAGLPDMLIEAEAEQARIDPDNVEILIQHLKCAAFELPFEPGDHLGDVPDEALKDGLEFLAHHRVVHPVSGANGTTYHWSSDAYPASHVSLRSIGWDNFVIIDLDSDKTLAEMDWRSTHTMLHEQAIYQHDGAQYQVERLDFENRKAFVRGVKPDYYTTAETHTQVTVLEEDETAKVESRSAWSLTSGLGEVSVVEKVVGFKKVRFHTHENVGYGEVHLPVMQKHTSAMWLVFPEDWIGSLHFPRAAIIDALRGLLNAMHLVAASGLMIDPRDLGKTLGDRDDADTAPSGSSGPGFDPTLFLYDSVPGGIGLAPRLFDQRTDLIERAYRLVKSCGCPMGCPACVGPVVGETGNLEQSPESRLDRKALLLSLMSDLGLGALPV